MSLFLSNVIHTFAGRTCDICGAYFASKKQQKFHSSVHGRRTTYHKQRAKRIISKREKEVLCELDTHEPTIEWLDEEDVVLLETNPDINENDPLALEGDIPIIHNLQEWLKPAFESDCFS